MIYLSELKMKEVILIEDGERLGFVDDLIINAETGQIISLIIMDRDVKALLFKKTTERVIDWKDIVTIGKDTILVEEDAVKTPREDEEIVKEK